jgi:serine/threonine protein kinase
LEDLHRADYCHRDIRLDNIMRCANTYVVIDLELAARADQHVFWRSDALPPEVAAGARVFGQLDDLWQLGKLSLGVELVEDGVLRRIHHLARRLVQRDVPSAREALEALQCL